MVGKPSGEGRFQAPRPDGPYAIVSGLYVGVVLGPLGVLGVAAVTTDAAELYIGFLVLVTGVAAVAGWQTKQTRGLAVSLGGARWLWLLPVVPLGWMGGLGIVWLHGQAVAGLVVLLAVFATGAGAVLGVVLVTMSLSRDADAVLATVSTDAAWEARWPSRWRRASAVFAAAAALLGGTGAIVVFVVDSDWGWWLYYSLFVAAPVLNVLNPRSFRATDAGLIVAHPHHRRFNPWTTYAAVSVGDSSLTIHAGDWWRPSHRCDTADIEDLDAVIDALGAHLDVNR